MPSSSHTLFDVSNHITNDLTAFCVVMVVRDWSELNRSIQRIYGYSLDKSAFIFLWAVYLFRVGDSFMVDRVGLWRLLRCSYMLSGLSRAVGYFNRKTIFDQYRSTKEHFVLTPLGVELVNGVVGMLGEMATQRLERLSQEPD
jgi:hypothetical protein